ncbi:MAG: NAD(P)H-dependent flavin oxidoreductase [Steroidobacteraceae bacterium]|jgi:NAD(P)H-dependent flavin oxidoreductase YrpB (nitropropane dioxygenase family)
MSGNDALQTPLLKMLGCRYPIVQTAMGWVARPELVAASCNAGAFGFLAAASLTADEVGPSIDRVRSMTDQPFGVNFHMFQPGASRIVDTIIAARVRAVSFGRGPDKNIIRRFRDAGIVCMPTVGALRHAQKMVEIGVDAITIQGGEGGGHTGSVPTTLLLPQVLDAVKVPVVAAGGFFDGRGLAAALAYGAAGVAMGTRFLMTRDCPVPEVTKTRYVRAGLDDIVLTTRLDGLQHRLLRNEILSEVENAGSVPLLVAALKNAWLLKQRTGASVAELISAARGMQRESGLTFGQALMAANSPVLIERSMIQGRPAEGVMSTGQVAGILSDLPTCEELIVRMVTEARQRLNALSGG